MSTRALALTVAAGALVMSSVLAGCGTPPAGEDPASQQSSGTSSSAPTPTPTPTIDPVRLDSNVKDGAKKVTVDTIVKVKAGNGTLTKVKLAYKYTGRDGSTKKGTVAGKVSKDKTAWAASDRLEPSAKYTLTMTGRNRTAQAATATTRFTTQQLTLAQQTFPQLYPLKGSRVGVGMPAVINFDVPVKNKAEIERHLTVVTAPKQAGSWRWFSDREVRYRPKKYWKPGTKVTVVADVNGVNAGGGIYGQTSAKTSFTVGRSMIVKVNLSSDVATVYRNGKAVRRIYVSAGKPGWQTRSGVKLIMAKEWNKKMTNEMIGAKEDYSLTAKYALRITNSGEFLHSAPWNAAHFGRRNASHGCTGMSNADAGWLINNTLIGDPVVTTGTSRRMELWNGYGDWNLSYAQYKKGSAL